MLEAEEFLLIPFISAINPHLCKESWPHLFFALRESALKSSAYGMNTAEPLEMNMQTGLC
jgi:hypothetical protein